MILHLIGPLLDRSSLDQHGIILTNLMNFQNLAKQNQNQCFLINSHEIISWNVDKHYLLDLQKKGIPIPESIFIPKNKSKDLSSLMKKNQWDEIVIKPTISGAAKNTFRLKKEDLSSFQNKWENLI